MRYFNTEAVWNQNIAASYLRLAESAEKRAVWDIYHAKIQTRMEVIYISTIKWIIEVFGYFDNSDAPQKKFDLQWLTQDENIAAQILEAKSEIQTRLRVTQTLFEQVGDIFSDDAQRQRVSIDQLGALPSSSSKTVSDRARIMGMAEYARLAPDDVRRKVADCWMGIITDGTRLRDADPGTPAAALNAKLSAVVANVNQRVDEQRQAMEAKFPDPQGDKMSLDTGLKDQPLPLGPPGSGKQHHRIQYILHIHHTNFSYRRTIGSTTSLESIATKYLCFSIRVYTISGPDNWVQPLSKRS